MYLQLSTNVFKHISWLQPRTEILLPDWIKEIQIDQLSQSNLSDSSYLSFLYGFLAMAAMEDLLDQRYDSFILSVLLPELLKLSKRWLLHLKQSQERKKVSSFVRTEIFSTSHVIARLYTFGQQSFQTISFFDTVHVVVAYNHW